MSQVIWLRGGAWLIRSVRLSLEMNPTEFAGLLTSRLGWWIPAAVLVGWEEEVGKPPTSVVEAVRELAERGTFAEPDGDETSSDGLREAT